MTADKVTWLAVVRFDAAVDMNDDAFLNALADVVERFEGESEDSIIGNLVGDAKGSLDDAFDAARGLLTREPRS